MRAVLCKARGGVDTLEITDCPTPDPGPGQVRVAVQYCGATYPDVLLVHGRYQFVPEYPFSPGCEFVGLVDGVGEGVTGIAPGDRVACVNVRGGGLADYAICDVKGCRKLPDSLPADDAVAMLGSYGTSLHALTTRGDVRKGETLLVLGASGGVGLAAVQIGKALGARVLGAVSSEDKRRLVLANGAHDAFVYPDTVDGDAQQKELSRLFKDAVGPGGADVIFDPVGGAYSEAALRAISWKGRHLIVGFASGIPSIPLNLPLLKGCQMIGVFLARAIDQDPDVYSNEMKTLMKLYRDKWISPHISQRFSLEQSGRALSIIENRRALGKILIKVREEAV